MGTFFIKKDNSNLYQSCFYSVIEDNKFLVKYGFSGILKIIFTQNGLPIRFGKKFSCDWFCMPEIFQSHLATLSCQRSLWMTPKVSHDSIYRIMYKQGFLGPIHNVVKAILNSRLNLLGYSKLSKFDKGQIKPKAVWAHHRFSK